MNIRTSDLVLATASLTKQPAQIAKINVRDLAWFIRLLALVRPYSMLSVKRKIYLYKLACIIKTQSITGDFVECGVYKGGSSALLAGLIKNLKLNKKKLHIFDSFEGFPEPQEIDGMRAYGKGGELASNVEEVHSLIEKASGSLENVKIYKGWFNETFPDYSSDPISFLHVDCDFYESVKLTLDTFYPFLSPNGFVVIDDYGSFEGCRVAVHEFLATHEPKAQLYQIDSEGYYFRKSGMADRALSK